jgi:hypothetical protein
MIDYEQLEQESVLFPWLDSDCMADHPYWEENYEPISEQDSDPMCQL